MKYKIIYFSFHIGHSAMGFLGPDKLFLIFSSLSSEAQTSQ